MSTTVLATKLFVPGRGQRLVARSSLVERLDRTMQDGHRLTLLSAPAGFGKTTLLSDWIATLRRRGHGVSVAWVSLDADDNDLQRVLTHLAAALAGAGLEVDASVLGAASGRSEALIGVLNAIVRAGDETPGRHWVLVLDDYHVIESGAVHEALSFLLDHLPDQLHLLMTTRSDPPLPLARMRGRGQLTEVRAADLRFTAAESREFLTQVMGLELSVEEVAALEHRTEGWIAGLQLAALSLREIEDRDAVARFIDAFTGSNRFIVDYLVEEVLARQPAAVRDFLLTTSVLDRLTGELCDAVTGCPDSRRMLEQLEHDNLFLVPLDTDRSWYRYHHLFAEVLRARLTAEQPDAVAALHRRAGSWYAARKLPADAVRHALAAGDEERAAFLVETALPELRRNRQDGVLLAWMRTLPEAVVRRSPVLSILSGWSLMMSGDLDGMEGRLDDAEAALVAGAEDEELAGAWAKTEDLRSAPAAIWIYRAALAQARGDVAGTAEHARRAMDLAEPDDHFVRGAGAGFLGLAAWAAGDVEGALSTYSEAVRRLHAAGNLVDELDSTVVLGDMWVTAGRPGRARRVYEEALSRAMSGGEPYPRATADLHVGLAELDRELDDLDGARARLKAARVLAERASITENRHRWHVAMAQVHAATGDHGGAREQLERASVVYRPGSYPDVRPIPAMRARVDIAADNLNAAEQWARDVGVTTNDDPTFLREYEHLTLARLILARHRRQRDTGELPVDHDPLANVLELLNRLHAAARPDRAGSLLEIALLRALTHHARGQLPEAVAELDRAVAAAPELDGYARVFLDEGASMVALLEDARARPDGNSRELSRIAGRLLDAAGDGRRKVVPTKVSGPASTAPLSLLSARELDVLRLLDSDLTGPQIARQLFVSLNTLRTHTKHIFTKLDVNNRSAAIRRGHQLGLLQP